MSARGRRRQHGQQGFTYLGLLFFIAILGASLGLAGELWSTQSQREKEADLLFAGRQIRAAIQSYSDSAPAGQQRRLPAQLQELLEDKRWPVTHRHLRRLYVDPMTGEADWIVIKGPGGGIVGVHSRAATRPFKRAGFEADEESFEGAASVAEWTFSLDTVEGGVQKANPLK